MVKPKPKSKRVPVRLRHKIEKASAAKGRKARKLAKANPQWRSRLKKDPGIPNLFPYKDRILAEIEEKKRLKDEEALRKKEEAKAARLTTSTIAAKGNENEDEDLSDAPSNLDSDESMAEDDAQASNPMAALLASARARAAEYDGPSDEDNDLSSSDSDTPQASTKRSRPLDPSLHTFPPPLQSLLQTSDILLYVLDARDPLTTRSLTLETQLRLLPATSSKPLILILNKIDLVPPTTLSAWLKHLRRSLPTLPLRASSSAPNARIFNHGALTAQTSSEKLLRALKSYAQKQDLKRSVTVGVLGFPNVGKSSVINALCSRLRSSGSRHRGSKEVQCPVGAEAGVTTSLRTVKVDGKLRVVDSPGVVFPTSPEESASAKAKGKAAEADRLANLTLLSALPPKQITDPIPAISLLLSRVSKSPEQLSALQAYYDLPALLPSASSTTAKSPEPGNITTDFLLQVARKRGRLGKGGVPNLRSAAMTVLGDWCDGRVSGWVEAPVVAEEEGRKGDQKEIVQGWGEAFRLEGLWGDEGEEEGGVQVGGEMEVEMAVR